MHEERVDEQYVMLVCLRQSLLSTNLRPLVKTAEKETAKPESLSVAYGQTFVYETGKAVVAAQEKVGQLPQTGTEEEWIGYYGLGTLLLSSLLFWKKKKEDVQG